MPKLANVTASEIKTADDAGSDLCMEMHEIVRRMEGGYSDPISSPVQLARSFLSLSRAAADLASAILTKGMMDEMRRETEAAIRARKSA